MKKLLTAVALMMLVTPVAAQDAPPSFPTRDVVVEYRLNDMNQTLTVHYAAQSQKMRANMAGETSYLITDRLNKRSILVMKDEKAYMEVPYRNKSSRDPLLPENATAVRGREETVADVRCISWQIQTPTGTSLACVTEDGVVLRSSEGGNKDVMEATAVRYVTQQPGIFEIPAGFRKMEIPTSLMAQQPPEQK